MECSCRCSVMECSGVEWSVDQRGYCRVCNEIKMVSVDVVVVVVVRRSEV